MKAKIKSLCLVFVAVAVALLGFLVLQKAEGAKPSGDIQLTAIIRGATTDKIQDDGQGTYISGVAPVGTVDVHLDQHYGNLFFYLDKGTNPIVMGRTVNFIFDAPVIDKPCMWMDCCPDLPFAYASVQPQIVRMRTWYIFKPNVNNPDLLEGYYGTLNLATMGMTVKSGKTTQTNPREAYVGMSINFYLTTDGEEHIVGGAEYAVKVTADGIGSNGPTHWTIQSLTYPLHKDDAADDDRQLCRIHEEFKTTVRCSYGWFNLPFQIDLYRK
jgi:hypothetical protein